MEPDVTVVALSGRMVIGTELQRIEPMVDDLLKKQEKKIIFDLAKVDFVDSSGLGVLVSCVSKAKKAGGQLRFVGISDRVMKLLKITHLDSTLSIDASREAACAALGKA